MEKSAYNPKENSIYFTKEGTLYRIKTSRYNVLIDDAFNIKQVVSDKGKVYTDKKNELSRVDIQSPLFNQSVAALEGAKPEVDLISLSENLPNVNESNAQNAADILSSLGIDVTGQIGLNFPNANDTDTDITNKKCKE
jgi:hypothetical protein